MQSRAMQKTLPGIVRTVKRHPVTLPKEPLQIRIPAAVKRKFKAQAAMQGIEPNELFVQVWDHYCQTVINQIVEN